MMTEKEIIKKLAEKYVEIWKEYEKNLSDYEYRRLDGKIDLLDDIFEEFFDIKDLYVVEGCLMSKGKEIGG